MAETNSSVDKLNQIIYTVLCNLEQISIDELIKINSNLDKSGFAHFDAYFKFAEEYYKMYDIMPNREYINSRFNNILEVVPTLPFHKNYVKEFITAIEKQATTTLVHTAMIQGDFEQASGLLTKYKSSSIKTSPRLSIDDVVDNYAKLRALYSHGLKTSIPELDKIYKFFAYKTLNVIVAPSGDFKTTTATSICYSGIFDQGLNIVYMTLEDNSEMIYYNFICRHSYEIQKPISAEEMKKFLLPDNRMPLLYEVKDDWKNKLSNAPGKLHILSAREVGTFTTMNIVNQLDEIKKEWGHIDVVVVDHFNIMNEPIPGLRITGPELYSYYVRFMTNLSITYGENGFILIGLSQANREAKSTLEKGKDMSTTQIANTSELERSATTLTSLYASNQHRAAGMVKMNILKNRIGQKDICVLPSIIPEYYKVGSTENELDLQSAVSASKVQAVTDNIMSSVIVEEIPQVPLNTVSLTGE